MSKSSPRLSEIFYIQFLMGYVKTVVVLPQFYSPIQVQNPCHMSDEFANALTGFPMVSMASISSVMLKDLLFSFSVRFGALMIQSPNVENFTNISET